ncbi:MAG: P-II family nitrogen regulator [Clostridiales bacterium]|nr:P-II family nitrogen regulator [Clostridiales bacterium]
MSHMNYLVTITKREYGQAFARYLYDNGVQVMTAALCEGTAQKKTLDLLGVEKTEKVMLSAVVSGGLSAALPRGLMRAMQIDVPGNGIAITIPLQSAANAASLQYLTKGQDIPQKEVKEMEEPRFSLVVTIAQRGRTDSVMEAARSAGAGGGTIIHAKGVNQNNANHFFGMSIASEQELVYIVVKKQDERKVMRAINERAGGKDSGISAVFSLPVNQVVGLCSLTDA